MHLREFKAALAGTKKVLVTGHTGFKGTWMTLLLEKLGIEVCGISLPPEPESLYERLGRQGVIEERFLDIRDFRALEKALIEFEPEVIFHMAAQPLVLESYKKPRETFETNVMGTVNVLDIAFSIKSVKLIEVITTDKVYKNENLGNRFTEDDSLAGKDPYSASKVGTEAVVSAWQQMSKINSGPLVTSVRAGNVIGGGDFAEYRLLPDLVKGFKKGEMVAIRNPESTRPWQHVLDPLIGYLLAAAFSLRNNVTQTFNFAPKGASLSVAKVCEIATSTWGPSAKVNYVPLNAVAESINLELDASLAEKELNWSPKWTQEEAVGATVSWWKSLNQDGKTANELCDNDLLFILGKYGY